MSATLDLARCVVSTPADGVPEAMLHEAKRTLINVLAISLSASPAKPARILVDWAKAEGANERATVVGAGLRTSLTNAALINGFLEQHGKDPHDLAEDDPTWLHYRAGVLTGFMRELRDALSLPITAIVMSNEQENLAQALDPAGWIAAGVVDTLVPYTDLPEWNHSAFSWQNPEALRPYVELTKGSSCELAPCFHTPAMKAEDYRNTAAGVGDNGADAFFFWWGDTGSMAHYGPEWSAGRRLGHLKEIEAWKAAGSPSLDEPVYPIQSLNGWDSKYVTPA